MAYWPEYIQLTKGRQHAVSKQCDERSGASKTCDGRSNDLEGVVEGVTAPYKTTGHAGFLVFAPLVQMLTF